jgi:transcriptional regulator GlxA family with amidase domain
MPPTDAALDPDQLRRLLRARDRMGAAPAAAWPVARCAKVAGMSASHFARAFKAAFGAPPHRYVLSLRLERAMALLRDTALPLREVAQAAGWRSTGSFAHTFRAAVGLTRGAWRERVRPEIGQHAAIPACVLRAALRPDLRSAVSENGGPPAAG